MGVAIAATIIEFIINVQHPDLQDGTKIIPYEIKQAIEALESTFNLNLENGLAELRVAYDRLGVGLVADSRGNYTWRRKKDAPAYTENFNPYLLVQALEATTLKIEKHSELDWKLRDVMADELFTRSGFILQLKEVYNNVTGRDFDEVLQEERDEMKRREMLIPEYVQDLLAGKISLNSVPPDYQEDTFSAFIPALKNKFSQVSTEDDLRGLLQNIGNVDLSWKRKGKGWDFLKYGGQNSLITLCSFECARKILSGNWLNIREGNIKLPDYVPEELQAPVLGEAVLAAAEMKIAIPLFLIQDNNLKFTAIKYILEKMYTSGYFERKIDVQCNPDVKKDCWRTVLEQIGKIDYQESQILEAPGDTAMEARILQGQAFVNERISQLSYRVLLNSQYASDETRLQQAGEELAEFASRVQSRQEAEIAGGKEVIF